MKYKVEINKNKNITVELPQQISTNKALQVNIGADTSNMKKINLIYNKETEQIIILRQDGSEVPLSIRNYKIDTLKTKKDAHVSLQYKQALVANMVHSSCEIAYDVPGHDKRVSSASKNMGILKSEINGNVYKVLVKVGDIVAQGDPILIVEAMKMENIIEAPCSGVLANINVEIKQNVAVGEVLVVITPEGSTAK